jgi:large subunit ribosomal protein L21
MFAVVEIAGKQYKVANKDKIAVPSMKEKVGSTVQFAKVLLLGDEKQVKVGNPLIAGAHVEAKIIDQVKADKVMVFKKKKRKGYRVKRGHRQAYTQVEISNIGA